MDDDDAADLLGELPADEQERLLTLMEPDEAEPVRRLLTYGDYTAGGLMTSEPVILLPDATVAEALALVRNPDLSPALAAQVYVVRPPQATPTGRFLGTAHIQRLLREPPSALVSGVVETDIDAAAPGRHARRGHPALRHVQPGRRAGRRRRTADCSARSSVDDVLDHLLPEDWRDRDAAADADTERAAMPNARRSRTRSADG